MTKPTARTTEPSTLTPTSLRWLRRRQVAERLGVSEFTIRDWVRAGRFPKAARLGPQTRAWSEATVAQWERERIAEVMPMPKRAA